MKIQDYLPYVTCAGVIGTALVSSKCTIEAEKILRDKNLENAPIQDKAKETWKYYIPVAAVAGATIVSVLVTNKEKHVPICCIDIYTYPMECWQEV